jgi:NAD(P)-dependent dehydrogenase (short-subunit alcohol dehydrogenase family)
MKLEDAKHAFVTGGASGIGLGVAKGLVDRGVKVTIADIDRGHLDKALADNVKGLRGVVLDVSDRAGWQIAKEEAEAAFGPVDILFNNAGIASAGFSVVDMEPESFEKVVAVDLMGVFNGIWAFGADMRERGRGHIVNTASMAGICRPSFGVGASYVAAKFGVVGLSEVTRCELAEHGIGVSVLCPGQVATGIVHNSARIEGMMRQAPPADMMTGGDVGELVPRVLDGIERNELYIISHGQGWWPLAQMRHQELEQAFEGQRD